MTYAFVIILTRIGERLTLTARINPMMPDGNTYPSKKQKLGFGNQAKCLKIKELYQYKTVTSLFVQLQTSFKTRGNIVAVFFIIYIRPPEMKWNGIEWRNMNHQNMISKSILTYVTLHSYTQEYLRSNFHRKKRPSYNLRILRV